MKKEELKPGDKVWVEAEVYAAHPNIPYNIWVDHINGESRCRAHINHIHKNPILEFIPTSERLPTELDADTGGRVLCTDGPGCEGIVDMVYAHNWKYWYPLSAISFPEEKQKDTIKVPRKEWEALKSKMEQLENL